MKQILIYITGLAVERNTLRLFYFIGTEERHYGVSGR